MRKLQLTTPVGNKILCQLDKNRDCEFFSRNPIFFESGTASLAIAIDIARLLQPEIKEPNVIIPAYACPDLVSSAKHAGVKANLVDLAPNSYEYDIESLLNSITENTVAIIVINFLGLRNDIGKIRSKLPRPITLIEDSAQGFPRNLSSKYWLGDLVVMSFGRGKPVSLCGGGALVCNNRELDSTVQSRELPVIAATKKARLGYLLKLFIYNRLLNPFLYYWLTRLKFLNIGSTQFKPLEKIHGCKDYLVDNFSCNLKTYSVRKQVVETYINELEKIKHPNLIQIVNKTKNDINSPLLRFPILIQPYQTRENIYDDLLSNGIGVSKMYKHALIKIDGISRSDILLMSDNENAEKFANMLLTLPTHERVTDEEVNLACRIIEKHLT